MRRVEVSGLSAWFGTLQALRDVGMVAEPKAVTAVIGPSGCGKSTFLRCLNRMHELVPGARVSGSVLMDGRDVYAPGVDPVQVRRRVGMVFQKPNPFPTMSISENVAAGLTLAGERNGKLLDEIVEQSLRAAALWDEVKDRLHKPGTSLSGGQQQRLCIARALAVSPEVLLMDEPASALDPPVRCESKNWPAIWRMPSPLSSSPTICSRRRACLTSRRSCLAERW